MKLMSNEELEASCIVANNRMNRERVALGSNGYESEIGFDPVEWLASRYDSSGSVCWLDLCCGRGKALIEAGHSFASTFRNTNSLFHGVDLVEMFDSTQSLEFVHLESATLHQLTTATRFDFITCVHGVHYIGDKLDLIMRARNWLKEDGQLIFSLDLSNLRMVDQPKFDFEDLLQKNGFQYNKNAHLLTSVGNGHEDELRKQQLEFEGADDQAGPNYSGQEAVNSYYRLCV